MACFFLRRLGSGRFMYPNSSSSTLRPRHRSLKLPISARLGKRGSSKALSLVSRCQCDVLYNGPTTEPLPSIRRAVNSARWPATHQAFLDGARPLLTADTSRRSWPHHVQKRRQRALTPLGGVYAFEATPVSDGLSLPGCPHPRSEKKYSGPDRR